MWLIPSQIHFIAFNFHFSCPFQFHPALFIPSIKSFSVGSQAPPHFFVFLRPTKIFLIPRLNILLPLSFRWPPLILLGTFQTAFGSGEDKAFYSKPELEAFKKRRPRLRKTYKSNSISKREMKRKTDSYQSCHVCDVSGWGRYILSGHTLTYYPERPKLSQLRIPVFKVSIRQGWMQRLQRSVVHG